jgi:hypothetical protein
MRTRIGLSLGLALAVIAALAPAAGAELRMRRPTMPRPAAVETFAISGTCSGAIATEVSVGGTVYRLAHGAFIYELGRGLVPLGTAYYDRVVTITGRNVRGTLMVDNVLVRPPSYSVGGTVGVMDESRPR